MLAKKKLGKELSPEQERVYWAAADGDFHSLLRALQNGISINYINPVTTDSPLMIACRKGHSQIVRLCLDYGAKNDPHPEFGQTALHAAVTSNQYDCAKILLDIAAASDADYIISNLTDQHSQTPLHSAVLLGSVDLTKLLLQHGGKISAVDSYGQTPLHICAGSSSEECLAMLLDHGGDEYLETIDIYGNTPLHHAAYNGNLNCVRLLLETAANVSAKNAKNLTAYNLATMQGHHQIGLLLLEYKDDLRPAERVQNSNYPPKPIRLTAFSPVEHKSNVSTPSYSKGEDSEFRTPMTFTEKKGLRKTLSMDPSDMSGNNLPRPHTVGSPSISSLKGGQFKKLSSASSASSPVDALRKTADGAALASTSNSQRPLSSRSYIDDITSSNRGYDVLSDDSSENQRPLLQLSTPLLSRESSAQYSSGGEKASPRERNSTYHPINSGKNCVYYPVNIADNNASAVQSSDDYSYMAANNQQKGLLVNNYFSNSGSYDYSNSESSESHPLQEVVLSTPGRKQREDYYVSTEGVESEYVDPIEVFDSNDRNWHVYMTEDQHIYYLDIVNSHSQWEDPRLYGIITLDNYDSLPLESPSKLSDGIPPPLSPAFRSPSSLKISPKSDIKEESITVLFAKDRKADLSMNSFIEEEASIDVGESLITATTGESFSVTSIAKKYRSRASKGGSSPSSSSSASSEDERFLTSDNLKIRNPSKGRSHRSSSNSVTNGTNITEGKTEQYRKSNVFNFDEKEIQQSLSPTRTSANFRAIKSFEMRNPRVQSDNNGSHKEKEEALHIIDSSVAQKLTSTNNQASAKDRSSIHQSNNNKQNKLSFNPKELMETTSHDDSNLKQFLVKRKTMIEEQEELNAAVLFPFPKKNLNDVLEQVKASPNKENSTDNRINKLLIPNTIQEGRGVVLEDDESSSDRDYYIQRIVEKQNTPQEIRLLLEKQGKSSQFILEILSSADERVLSFQSVDDKDEEDDKNNTTDKANSSSSTLIESAETKQTRINENLTKLLTLSPNNKTIYEKYVKMYKLGVQPANILQKMSLDGMDQKYIKELEKAFLLSSSSTVGSGNNANMKKEVTAKDLLLMKDWTSFTNHERLKNSIWAFSSIGNGAVSDSGNALHQKVSTGEEGKEIISQDGLLAENELKEFEDLFLKQQKPPSSGNHTKGSNSGDQSDSPNMTEKRKKVLSVLQKTSKQAPSLRILEGKRAQNIIIGLVPFKSLSTSSSSSSSSSTSSSCNQLELIKSICALNTMNNQLTIDHLENFKYLLPTESELKLSYQLKQLKSADIQHPAEIFLQAVIFFYPELPIRLNIFIICLSLLTSIQSLDKRMKTMMNMVNQVVSSPKLAKIMQKLLIIGRVMIMESSSSSSSSSNQPSLLKSKLHPNKSSTTASNGKMTILEQLILISNTKGIDKKTSVMDYVVKSLYDKNEEDLLGVLDDLSLITNSLYHESSSSSSSSSSSTMNSHQVNTQNPSATASTTIPHQFASVEIFQDYQTIQKQFQQLTQEYERNTQLPNQTDLFPASNTTASDIFASPTAKRISNEYLTNLETYIYEFREQINLLMKKKLLLNKKLQQLIEYFGEEREHYLITLPAPPSSSSSSATPTAAAAATTMINQGRSSSSSVATTITTVYDVSNIFLALKDFSKSLAFSKESYEWKLSRK